MEEPNLYILFFVLLILLSSYFSAAETSFSSLKIVRLEAIIKKKAGKKFHFSKSLHQKYTSTLLIILILNNIVNLTAAAFSVLIFTNLNVGNPIFVSTVVTTIIILVFGEFLPKAFTARYPEHFAYYLSLPLYLLVILLKPITYLISFIVKNKSQKAITEKELISTLDKIADAGEIEKSEKSLISSAIKFDDKTLKGVYTKWKKVIKIKSSNSIKQAKKMFLKHKFSRLPVMQNDKPLGFITIKDVFASDNQLKVANIVKEANFISQHVHLDDVLEAMQKNSQHFVFVTKLKNQSKPIGIVTLEDLIEEIVGEIYDETDLVPWIQPVGHNEYLVDGRVKAKKLFKTIDKKIAFKNGELSFFNWIKKTTKKKEITTKFNSFLYNDFKIELAKWKGKKSKFLIKEHE